MVGEGVHESVDEHLLLNHVEEVVRLEEPLALGGGDELVNDDGNHEVEHHKGGEDDEGDEVDFDDI